MWTKYLFIVTTGLYIAKVPSESLIAVEHSNMQALSIPQADLTYQVFPALFFFFGYDTVDINFSTVVPISSIAVGSKIEMTEYTPSLWIEDQVETNIAGEAVVELDFKWT